MSLSKAQAQAIVDAVKTDPEVLRRLRSGGAQFVPDRLGVTGALRNWKYVFTGKDPTEESVANAVCTGIADATSAAINKSLAKLPGVSSATVKSRVYLKTDHTATLVNMSDGTSYVFDWHATLNPANPFVGEAKAWETSTNQVDFNHFGGLP